MPGQGITAGCGGKIFRLLLNQGGQTSVEYMLAIALLVCGVLVGLFLLVPGLEDGFVVLTQRIRDMNP